MKPLLDYQCATTAPESCIERPHWTRFEAKLAFTASSSNLLHRRNARSDSSLPDALLVNCVALHLHRPEITLLDSTAFQFPHFRLCTVTNWCVWHTLSARWGSLAAFRITSIRIGSPPFSVETLHRRDWKPTWCANVDSTLCWNAQRYWQNSTLPGDSV